MVGLARERFGDDTMIIVMSDHGFTSWNRILNLNTWLVDRGYLVLEDPDLEEDPGFFGNVDPKTGQPAITAVYQREQIYEYRDRIEIGPDIQMGYAKGTQGSGKGALGDIEREMFRDNTDDWSGNHIMDLEAVPGVLFTSRPLGKPASSLQNLAASILAEFGIEGDFPRTDR